MANGRYVTSCAIYYQPSAISYQPSAISYQLSAIGYQLSAISYLPSAMIEITVKLYASLRRFRPGVALGEAFTCSVPEDMTIEQLLAEVLQIPPDEVAIPLVNGIMGERQQTLSAGDQIALWPPVAGGVCQRN